MNPVHYPIVLVLGLTGAGKSTFIRSLVEDSDKEKVSVGHRLSPHTLSITEYQVKIGNETATLVDTPGLDNPGSVFEGIDEWMSQRETPIKSVDGIILLHPINRNRMTEESVSLGALREAFGKVLGTKLESQFPFFRVALVTTLWTAMTTGVATKAAVEEEYANQLTRERELQDDWWRLLQVQGAMFKRHDNTMESVKEIVSSVINAKISEPKMIHVQDQLIISVIGSTQAGKSSFVEALTQTSLLSKTNEIRMESIDPYEIEINNENVILLDTPGLDATGNPTHIFQMIAEWLKVQARQTGKSRLYLDGIVVVHPILSDEEFGELVLQSLLIDQANKLLGNLRQLYDAKDPKAYRRIILSTTKWDKVNEGDLQIAIEKERKIKKNNWNIMSVAGSPIMRFDNTTEAARRIIKVIVEEKKSSDVTYQYRNIKAALNEINSGLGLVQGGFDELKKAQKVSSEQMAAFLRTQIGS